MNALFPERPHSLLHSKSYLFEAQPGASDPFYFKHPRMRYIKVLFPNRLIVEIVNKGGAEAHSNPFGNTNPTQSYLYLPLFSAYSMNILFVSLCPVLLLVLVLVLVLNNNNAFWFQSN